MSGFAAEMNGVGVRYGAFDALSDVTFAAPVGAFVAIVGPNGAGKSTLINVLLGLQVPTTGTVHVLGGSPNDLPAEQLGYVPQLKTLDRTFPAVALELVVTGLRRSWPWRIRGDERAAALEAMKRTGVDHLADRPIAKLSGGETQRVYLARSLARKPKFIVLDEPAAGLDMGGEAEMYHVLIDYQRASGATVFMVTHDWEGARVHASHVLLLDRGVAGFGPPEEAANEEKLLQVFGFAGHTHRTHKDHNHGA
jgi:zinc transport system ATP-binding protein